MIEAILNYNYMQHALIAAILTSVICGIMGTIIVEKKLVSMSGGIAHASFGGIGAGYFFGIEPIIGGLLFAVMTSLTVGQIKRKYEVNADAVVSMFWSGGMAIGILFVALTPGYPPDMTSYLFGDILTVNRVYLYVMAGLSIIVVAVFALLYNYWKLYLFDEEYAGIIGIKTVILETILYILISLSIVVLIKVVGIILSIAMLTIPPLVARQLTNKLNKIMIYSGLIGAFFTITGLTLSYYLNIPSGATIILVAILTYFVVLGLFSKIKVVK